MQSKLRFAHLRAFSLVASHSSMQAAARSLRISQPAVSKLIQDLEDTLGARLFVRTRRGVSLTEAGRTLAVRSEQLLNDLAATCEEVAAVSMGATGSVRIGVLPVAVTKLLPSTLSRLFRTTPGLSIHIEEGTTAALLGSLMRGEIDCVLGRLDRNDISADLEHEKLIDLPISIVTGTSHPLAQVRRPKWRDLAQYTWIVPPVGSPIRLVIEMQFALAGVRLPVTALQSTATQINASILQSSDLVGVMGVDAASEYAAAKKLRIIDVPMPLRLPPIGIVTRPGHVSRALGAFQSALREQCKVHH